MDRIFGFEEFLHRETLEMLQEYHFIEGGNNEAHNREAVLAQLKKLCNQSEVEDERILWWEKKENQEEVYLVCPVMLSLLLKEYQYTQRLLDLGYQAADFVHDTQIYYRTSIPMGEFRRESDEIYITQVLMAQDDIPDALLSRIYYEICSMLPVFSFAQDIWGNPFLYYTSEQKVPDMTGLEKIYRNHIDWLQDMTEDEERHIEFIKIRINFLKKGLKKKLFCSLLEYFSGMEMDLAYCMKLFMPYVDDEENFNSNSQNEIKFWVKYLTVFESICIVNPISQKVFFESLITLLGYLHNDFFRKQREECYPVLLEAAKRNIADYTCEEYLEYIQREKSWKEYGYYLKIWKKITNRPLVLGLSKVWDMFHEIFNHISMTSPEFFDNSLMLGISFVETIDEIILDEEDKCEYNSILVELIYYLLKFNSEELVLACLKNKLLPKSMISICMQSAIRFQKLRIIPVLILFQNQTEGGEYVYDKGSQRSN